MVSQNQDESLQKETRNNTNFITTGDPLAIIYNENLWKLNLVSPLYNLQYAPVKLKATSSEIRQSIVSSVSASATKYSVKVQELPNLKYCEDDASALMITVTSSVDKARLKETYMAIILSWGESENIDNATHLPYMLEHGEQRVGAAVKSTLQALYDCTIRQLTFSQKQILQLGFSFVACGTSRDTDSFTLTYKTPQTETKDKVDITLTVEDINLIWNMVQDDSLTQLEQVTNAYTLLQCQIVHAIKLDVTIFDLIQISLPKADVKNIGTVKMKSPEMINCLFVLLNNICK